MGSDIHAVVEVDYGADAEPFTGDQVIAFAAGPIFIDRDYRLFAALADGRRTTPGLCPPHPSLHPPRGLPGRLSIDVTENYEEERRSGDGQLTFVPNPNWHSASWPYRDEIFAALDHDRLAVADLYLTFRVVLDVMANVDDHLGPRRSRLVFWFDN